MAVVLISGGAALASVAVSVAVAVPGPPLWRRRRRSLAVPAG